MKEVFSDYILMPVLSGIATGITKKVIDFILNIKILKKLKHIKWQDVVLLIIALLCISILILLVQYR